MGARMRTSSGTLASPTRTGRLRPNPLMPSTPPAARTGRNPGPRLVLVFVALACLLLRACSSAESNEQSSWSVDREKLNAAFSGYEDVIPDFDQLRAVVVATEDRIVFEQYYGSDEDTYGVVNSVTKSVVSTLIGIALHEGLIGSLDDTLAELLPEHAAAMSTGVAGTTLRQLLTMTAGFPGTAGATAPDFTGSENYVRDILAHPESPPGGRFLYSDGTSHLLAAVLEEATGTSALHFARSRLFEPLGIDTHPAFHPAAEQKPQAEGLADYQNADFAWPRDPQGVSTGWWGIKLRPRDMVKIGQLFLASGRWDNKQVVPADWVDQATTRQVAADGPLDGYGYQWWTGTPDDDEAFAAVGYGGQIIEVVPDRNLVVVTATEMRENDVTSQGIDNTLLLNVIEDDIISEVPAG